MGQKIFISGCPCCTSTASWTENLKKMSLVYLFLNMLLHKAKIHNVAEFKTLMRGTEIESILFGGSTRKF
jgi:hypothetical protein